MNTTAATVIVAARIGCFSALAGPGALAAGIVGHSLTGAPTMPQGDTGSVLIVDGFHNPGAAPSFTIPAGGAIGARTSYQFQGIPSDDPWRFFKLTEKEPTVTGGEYAGRSMNGNHDLYLQNLTQLVTDLNSDLKLDTVHVGIIGNVPHTINGSVLSNRANIFQIRRALQSSWLNPKISPGPVVYDVALDSEDIHIHFNTPEEMIPLAKRWAAAISEFTYKTGVGRGPILQQATLAADRKTVVLTFDKDLKITDFRNSAGTKTEGWSFEQATRLLTDADVESATVAGTVATVRLKSAVAGAWTASYGIDHDGDGKKILRGLTDLPAEPFYRVPLQPL
ncbi:MAG: hypothetical protein ACKV19_25675 [Verrucomicrobiales bacterium]